jgi:hypothetical protein
MTNEELVAAALSSHRWPSSTVATISGLRVSTIMAIRRARNRRITVDQARSMGIDAFAEAYLTSETISKLDNEARRRQKCAAENYRNAAHAA